MESGKRAMAQRIPVISLLLPSRQRPTQLMRLYKSATEEADYPHAIEMVVYVDEDDSGYDELIETPPRGCVFIKGPRKTISKCWNECWEASTGEIYFHAGDDVVIRTKGWDTIVRNLFDEYTDKIVFAYGDDGNIESSRNDFGTHGFIHKNWTDIVGYFVPPYYESDYNDTHLNDLAKGVGRHRHIDVLTEHMHFSLGKSEMDQNTKDRLERHEKQNPGELYEARQQRIERADQIEKLRVFIGNHEA